MKLKYSEKPIIRWSGSKRNQAKEIIKYFPKNIDTYYEPFCGGASILYRLLISINNNENIQCKNFICSDINKDLINVMNFVKNEPDKIYDQYGKIWQKFYNMRNINDKERSICWYELRDELNKNHSPHIFFFITRTCYNGLTRYNSDGKFNSAFHPTRNGITPKNLKPILDQWNFLLNQYNVEFKNCSYDIISPNKNDFVYLDPPYINCKGMYFGTIDYDKLWNWMKNLSCNYIMSFDGKINNEKDGETNNTYEVPSYLYNNHIYINGGISSFRGLAHYDNNTTVNDSLYINIK